jgi:hypothetical protein
VEWLKVLEPTSMTLERISKRRKNRSYRTLLEIKWLNKSGKKWKKFALKKNRKTKKSNDS